MSPTASFFPTPQRLIGKTAIVTGATSGIGTAVAIRLHAEGANVLITGRNVDAGARIAGELGARASFLPADLATESSASALVAGAIDAFGGLDILVNNAALDHTGDVLTTPMDDVREIFEVNTFAALRMLQAAGIAMRATGGGSIVNVSSRLASIGVPTMGIYSAAKGAVLSLTRAAAIELAPHNIRVNAVAPGMTRTPLYEAWLAGLADPVAAEAATTSSIPLGRLASPEDVAAAIAYLVSDEAAYLTGVSLPIDGGYTAQ